MIEFINQITPPDEQAMRTARDNWNAIAKPLGSLGLLEQAVVKIAGITSDPDVTLDKRCVVVLCADNGVVCEGVTQSDSEVTAIVAKAIAEGTSNISLMAHTCRAQVMAVDIGMKETLLLPGMLRHKIAEGTGDIAQGAAMTLSEAERAIEVGMHLVQSCHADGCRIIVTGEMGIGNTTTSAAIASVLLGLPPEKVTGRGAGLDSEGLRRKIAVIRRAIAVNHPDKNCPVELLAKLGGYDIAGMVGLYLGGALYKVPVVIDGFISAVAAALACEICPAVRDYMLCSHVSKEPAGQWMLDYLGLRPLITAELCLGEGTGGVLLLPLLDAALAVYHSSHTFDNLPMERYVKWE